MEVKYNLLMIKTFIFEALYALSVVINENMHDLLVDCFIEKAELARELEIEDEYL